MKATWILIAASITMIGYFWADSFRRAKRPDSGDVTVSPAGDVGGDLITAGRDVNVRAGIEGDLAVAGMNVTVTGRTQGYVMAAGSNVNINGAVGNDLWAAGANVSVNAPVADNANLAGNSVVLQPQASVGRNAYMAGNHVEALGRVEGDLKVAAESVRLGSEIGGSAQANAGVVKVLPGAVIRGDLIVTGPNAPEIAPGAQVYGRIAHNVKDDDGRWGPVNWLARWTAMFLATLILGAAMIALSARWTDRITEKLRRRPGYALLAGVVGLIVIPLICVLLAVTVIGIPLAIVLLALYLVALMLSGVFVSYLIGGWLLGRLRRTGASPYARMAVGALALAFLASLPWIGWAIQLLTLMTGLGALILERKDARRRLPAESLA